MTLTLFLFFLLFFIVNLKLDIVFMVVIAHAAVFVAVLLQCIHSLRQIILVILILIHNCIIIIIAFLPCLLLFANQLTTNALILVLLQRWHLATLNPFLLHGQLSQFSQLLLSLRGHFLVLFPSISLARRVIILLY